MKILTREVIETLTVEAVDVATFIAKLTEGGYVREEPKLRMSKREIADVLKLETRVRTELTSSYILNRLVDAGYLTREKDDQHVSMGRKPYLYPLTGKGRGLVAMSANWKSKENA